MPSKIMLIQGPNLNLLGTEAMKIYGKSTLKELETVFSECITKHNHHCQTFQSNEESALIDKVHEAIEENYSGIVINGAAYCHTSIALKDALAQFEGAKIELHIGNVYKREEFRHFSQLSSSVDGIIMGFGDYGYKMAAKAILNMIK